MVTHPISGEGRAATAPPRAATETRDGGAVHLVAFGSAMSFAAAAPFAPRSLPMVSVPDAGTEVARPVTHSIVTRNRVLAGCWLDALILLCGLAAMVFWHLPILI